MNGLHAVIMAGGSGMRFWPMSREMWPKQMLKIKVFVEGCMERSIARVREMVGGDRR
jgi:mannose-1-phosphate guanylyltransferase